MAKLYIYIFSLLTINQIQASQYLNDQFLTEKLDVSSESYKLKSSLTALKSNASNPNIDPNITILPTSTMESKLFAIQNQLFKDEVWGIKHDQLDKMFDQSSGCFGIFQLSRSIFIRVSKDFVNTIGWPEKTILNTPLSFFLQPEDVAPTETMVDVLKEGASSFGLENCYRCFDGSSCWFQWTTLNSNFQGSNDYVLVIGRNITTQKLLSIELNKACLKADTANQAKSTFVSHMSHELRTPLNGIMGFLELALRENNISPVVQDYLNNAYTSTQSLKAIANDILDLSRIETDAFKLEVIPFNPLIIAQEVVNSFKFESENKNITLKLKSSLRVPVKLMGDPLRFRQILFNLVGNSIKFTTQGSITIKLDGVVNIKQPSKFSFIGTVKDTGIGMDAETVTKLFQPFTQADDSIMRKYGGTGLGLYITKQLCEKMDGTIKVSSEPGLGSIFEYKLLLTNYERKHSAELTNNEDVPQAQEYTALPVLNILIAEDNVMNQKLLKAMLEKEKCTITIAKNGQEAVDAVKDNDITYDLILMDGEMPIMDGLEATRLIRELIPATRLPIIGLTGHAMTTHKELFLNSGMNGYLTKPIAKQTLFDEILYCLSHIKSL